MKEKMRKGQGLEVTFHFEFRITEIIAFYHRQSLITYTMGLVRPRVV